MNKVITMDYEEYLKISGWAEKYLEILKYANIPLTLLERDLLNDENSYTYLTGILKHLERVEK